MTAREGLVSFRSRWSLVSLATLAFWLGVQALKPFVALHLADLGASEVEIGLAVAAHPLLSLFLAVPAGRFVDRRGLRRYMLVSLVLAAVTGIAYAFTRTIVQVALLQLVTGLAELGAWIGMQALVTRAGESSFRQRQVALFSIAWGLGIAFGPTLGAWLFDARGLGAVGIAYAALALVAAAAVWAVPYRDARHTATGSTTTEGTGMRAEVRSVTRRPAILAVLAASFVALWANSLRTTFYPIFLEEGGLSVPAIGFLMSLAGVTTLVGRIPLLWLVRRFGAGRVLVSGAVTVVGSLSLTPVLVTSSVLLAVASGLFGLGFGLVTPLTVDLMAEHSADEHRGLTMGMRVAANRAAQVLQPVAFGAAAGLLGMTGGFTASGVVMGAGTAIMARWLRSGTTPGAAATQEDVRASGRASG